MNTLMYRLTSIHHRLDEKFRRELERRIPDIIRLLKPKGSKRTAEGRLRRAFPRPDHI